MRLHYLLSVCVVGAALVRIVSVAGGNTVDKLRNEAQGTEGLGTDSLQSKQPLKVRRLALINTEQDPAKTIGVKVTDTNRVVGRQVQGLQFPEVCQDSLWLLIDGDV